MSLPDGTRIKHYEVLSPIGTGGMGEVYLAHDTRLGRKVAIKLLSEEYNTGQDRLRRFIQEAKAASALNHPNIITIHEIGETETGAHYIATEYIEGETLRQHLQRGYGGLRETLDVAAQIAGALSAAHDSGIIHRDIKPENVMLRPDGYVKVLDFGLAKLIESQSASITSDATTVKNSTAPGIVMGTARYMSPEQARGKEIDSRTDIFSLGVILYEMTTGHAPFDGESIADILAAVLYKEPLPLTYFSTSVPPELQRIVGKSLRKNREERYQTMKDLLVDLKTLRDELHLQSKLDVTFSRKPSGEVPARAGETQSFFTETAEYTAQSSKAIPSHPTAKAVDSLTTQKTHSLITWAQVRRRGAVLAAFFLGVAAVAVYFYFTRQPVLTEQDTLLLTDFVNTTGDPIFDGTLKQGLAVQLQQSPFLNLYPDTRVRQTLRLMGRSPDERVTAQIGQEICERQGLKALIVGSIAPLGSHYVITLEAINGHSGDVLARGQGEAESKEQVLKTLSQAASQLREKLGESLNSIQKYDAPLEDATTPSIEAFKAFSQGVEQAQNGRLLEAIPYLKRAVELDPNFAYAYGTLAVNYSNTQQSRLAEENATKAFGLLGRLSEPEKLRVRSFYFAFVTGEVDRGIEVVNIYKSTYPRDERGPLNLSDRYSMIGQYEKAVAEAEEARQLNPNNAIGYWDLAGALIRLNRFEEAQQVCERAVRLNLDTTAIHSFLYQLAQVNGNAAMAQEQVDWAAGKPDEFVALEWQAMAAAGGGQARQSQEFSRHAIDTAMRSETYEIASRYAADAAVRAAIFGEPAQAKTFAARTLATERNHMTLARAALALALGGESAQAQALVDELLKRRPKDTLINELWLPAVRGALLLSGNAQAAVDQLKPALRYEPAGEFWPQYLRGQAYLKLNRASDAATEFQKIINHRGEAPLSALYPLAYLGLARASALLRDTAASRDNYQHFFALWKDADADLPVLVAAKKEYDKLK